MLHVEFDRERVLSSCIFLGTQVTFVGRRLVAAHVREMASGARRISGSYYMVSIGEHVFRVAVEGRVNA
jgi:hypothetical protein